MQGDQDKNKQMSMRYMQRIQELNEQMADYVATIDKLNAEKDVLKLKIKDFRGEKRDYQNEIYQLEKDLNDVLLDLDYEQKINQRLRDRLARLENQGDNYEIDRKNK